MRRHLTFANVCSLLALTVALGTGGAYAANTIFSSDIVDGEVRNADLGASAVSSSKIQDGQVQFNDIAASAVSSSRIANGSVSGDDLGVNVVSSTKILDNAVGSSDVNEGALVFPCPTGTLAHAGACIETAARTAAPYLQAQGVCAQQDRRLASWAELASFRTVGGVTLATGGELSDIIFFDATTVTVMGIDDGGFSSRIVATDPRPYRCVAPRAF